MKTFWEINFLKSKFTCFQFKLSLKSVFIYGPTFSDSNFQIIFFKRALRHGYRVRGDSYQYPTEMISCSVVPTCIVTLLKS